MVYAQAASEVWMEYINFLTVEIFNKLELSQPPSPVIIDNLNGAFGPPTASGTVVFSTNGDLKCGTWDVAYTFNGTAECVTSILGINTTCDFTGVYVPDLKYTIEFCINTTNNVISMPTQTLITANPVVGSSDQVIIDFVTIFINLALSELPPFGFRTTFNDHQVLAPQSLIDLCDCANPPSTTTTPTTVTTVTTPTTSPPSGW